MKSLSNLLAIVAASMVAMVATQAGAETWQTVYQTDFSSDPGWTTDDPTNLRWDSATGTFHGTQVNVQGTYAYKNVAGFDPNKSWKLAFDSEINSCGWSAGLTLGLFDSRLTYPWGAIEDQGWSDGGNGTALVTNGVGAGVFSPGWSSGTWYHTLILYDATTEQVTMNITDRSTGSLFQSQTQTVTSFPSDMTYLGVSRLHMKNGYNGVNPNASVDYNLDNVVLSQATPKSSSVPEPSSLVVFSGLGVMGLVMAWRRRKRAS
jgi:hypothetical protein